MQNKAKAVPHIAFDNGKNRALGWPLFIGHVNKNFHDCRKEEADAANKDNGGKTKKTIEHTTENRS